MDLGRADEGGDKASGSRLASDFAFFAAGLTRAVQAC
jgi:hypothetical protein